ncbi:hypothetical protein TNCV_724461 [Trichonephila clavipes]|nr:hypothetical protein TNCV_724461 [Trichonephila clavipes]
MRNFWTFFHRLQSRAKVPSESKLCPKLHHPQCLQSPQLLPSTSSVTITLSSESQPPIPLTNSAPAISTSLSTPETSSSSTPSVILPSTSDRMKNLSTEIQPPVPLLDTYFSYHIL